MIIYPFLRLSSAYVVMAPHVATSQQILCNEKSTVPWQRFHHFPLFLYVAFFHHICIIIAKERTVLEPIVPFPEWLTGSMNGSFFFHTPLKITASQILIVLFSKFFLSNEIFTFSFRRIKPSETFPLPVCQCIM